MNYALREALALVVEEGLEARIARHAAERPGPSRPALAAMGLGLATAEGHRLPQLTCVRIPDGHRRPDRAQPAAEGVGHRDRRRPRPVQGKGLADRPDGSQLGRENVTLVLAALETCLRDLGHAARRARP